MRSGEASMQAWPRRMRATAVLEGRDRRAGRVQAGDVARKGGLGGLCARAAAARMRIEQPQCFDMPAGAARTVFSLASPICDSHTVRLNSWQ
mmetsp:Transcript_13184/g.30959  ORF Transcript_13184/g.30959 Transcript_13184/m.30959 type:complete len:92 (-) Transcript_13184:31-306(-)